MNAVVQAACPGCQKVLRIPADWVDRPMKCKECGTTFQARPKPGAAPLARPTARPPSPRPSPPAEPPANAFAEVKADEKPRRARRPPPPTTAEAPPPPPIPRSSRRLLVGVIAGVVAIAVAAVVVFVVLPRLGSTAGTSGDGGPRIEDAGTSPEQFVSLSGDLPNRRALLVGVHRYLYWNPMLPGSPADVDARGLGVLRDRLVVGLHFPRERVTILSDGLAPEPESAIKPTRESMRKTITDFLAGARKQDCALLLFTGHAVELEKETYLVPYEGEKDKEALVPLKWLFERLAECPARQKVLVLDVCRFNPGRPPERPASGPEETPDGQLQGALWPALDELLKKPPEGVQVWTACVAGQYSYEFEAGLNGGLFLSALEDVLPTESGQTRRPADFLPLERLEQAVNARMKGELAQRKKEQTSRVTGSVREEGVRYDSTEPPAARLEIKPPALDGGIADVKTVQSILDELVVPFIGSRPEEVLKAGDLPPLSAKALEEYQKDEKTPFRATVEKARDVLRKQLGRGVELEFVSSNNEKQFKDHIEKIQKDIAHLQTQLTDATEALDDLKGQREKASRRWQAHYDFTRAALMEQTIHLFEYNRQLGTLRKGDVETLDPTKHNGWRMVSRSKLVERESKALDKKWKEALGEIAEKHKGTPWEILAKREQTAVLGFDWETARIVR